MKTICDLNDTFYHYFIPKYILFSIYLIPLKFGASGKTILDLYRGFSTCRNLRKAPYFLFEGHIADIANEKSQHSLYHNPKKLPLLS